MANFKSGRVAEDMKREISAMVRDLKDPRISSQMLTIVRCDVSNDLSHCKVYVSSMSGFEKAKEAVKGFESASGLIKRQISNALHLKKCPEMKFIADNSGEHSAEINRILKDIEEKNKEHENNTEE